MNVEEIIKKFIANNKPEGYEKDIRVFINFLKSKDIPIINVSFQGVRTKDVIESMDYYITENNLKAKSPVKRYANAISEFFKYIIGNGYIDNKTFYEQLLLPTMVNDSYWGKVNEFISKNKRLKEKDTFDILTKKEVMELIANCDHAIERYIENIDDKIDYNKVVAALSIKLISLTGVLHRQLRKIKLTNDIEKFNKICISNFRIILPEKYSMQLKKYLEIRKYILEKSNKQSEYLFLTFEGEQLARQTGFISSFLARCTGRNDLNGLIKYSIGQMIMSGVNDSVINRLTCAGNELIKQAIENEETYDELYWNKYLDSRLRTIELFDLI